MWPQKRDEGERRSAGRREGHGVQQAARNKTRMGCGTRHGAFRSPDGIKRVRVLKMLRIDSVRAAMR